MVDVAVLKDAVECKIDSLREELRYNRKILNNADGWAKAIEQHIVAAKRCFGFAGHPEFFMEVDDDTGQPYACISVEVKDSMCAEVQDQRRAYLRQVRKVDAKFAELIVLDVDSAKESEQE